MMTSLYSEQIPVAEITSDWCKFHFPRDSRVITRVNLTLALACALDMAFLRVKVVGTSTGFFLCLLPILFRPQPWNLCQTNAIGNHGNRLYY
jgi:hypothetical protein